MIKIIGGCLLLLGSIALMIVTKYIQGYSAAFYLFAFAAISATTYIMYIYDER